MSSSKIIIAIDGHSSSGKSTMARRLASAIGYRYVDSGAMYRAVTLYAIRNGLIDDQGNINVPALADDLDNIKIDFVPAEGGQHTTLNGEDVESEIRSMKVSSLVSPISTVPVVRERLARLQNEMGREKGIVMDGRDIGTTVFPDAELKIFVNAPAEVRAERRLKELLEKGVEATYEQVLDNVRTRDHIDSTREVSPLRRADDAIDLDNSDMTIQQQDEWLLNQFNNCISKIK